MDFSIKKILSSSRIEKRDAELLLSFVIGKNREHLFSYPEEKVNLISYLKFKYFSKKIAHNWPLAYIVGQKSFYANDFFVNNKVLVPRPETEIMVNEIIKHIDKTSEKFILIDVGTGSACIPISIYLSSKEKIDKVLALDISKKALQVAKLNIQKFNLDDKICLLESDLLENLHKSNINIKDKNIITTANLPYLSKEQIKESPSIKREPLLALDGGKNGMEYYIKLLNQIKSLILAKNPKSFLLISEIEPSQKTIYHQESKQILPSLDIKTIKDYSGYDRFVLTKI